MMGIYEICNLHDGKATAYVGSSVDIQQRWRQHQGLLRRGKHDNPHLQCAWDKYGETAFEWCIIEEVHDEARLLEQEQYWLDRFLENPNACYNIATTAGPGGTLSEEHKRKIGEAMMGKQNYLGYRHTDETRRKISEAQAEPYPALRYRETGEVIPAGRNLARLCGERNLSQGAMNDVKNGKRKSHKGWRLA